MRIKNTRVLITGASRGLGAVLADSLAAQGADLMLVARSQVDLEVVRSRVARHGTRVLTQAVDLGASGSLEPLVEHARSELGAIDILVNNAGLERIGFYEDLTASDIEQVIALNLTVPMQLSRLVLPDMLQRNRGHLLNIASIAGLVPFAFGETYGATKHGLVGFTRALRTSLKERGSAVSASVLCPGFVWDTGMFQEARDRHGVVPHWLLGSCTSSQVAQAALRAIERDDPEIVVNSTPLQDLAALSTALPRMRERVAKALDFNAAARILAERRRKERKLELELEPSG